jgi:hypothetical protein
MKNQNRRSLPPQSVILGIGKIKNMVKINVEI